MSAIFKKLFKKQQKVKLEFCQNNLDTFLDDTSLPLLQELFNQQNITVKEYHCLSRCEQCKMQPYAMINENMISAETITELVITLQNHIKK